MSHERWQEWIELAVDDELGARERRELDAHLEGCAECRGELAESRRIAARLAAAAIPVRPGFTAEVMAALAPAPWEARSPRAWLAPLVALLAVGGAAAVLLGVGAVDLGPHAGGGPLLAMLDLFRAAFVAGGGIAVAAWGAVGDAVGSWLGRSAASWIAFGGLALGANYLLYRLVRRRPRGAEARHRSPR